MIAKDIIMGLLTSVLGAIIFYLLERRYSLGKTVIYAMLDARNAMYEAQFAIVHSSWRMVGGQHGGAKLPIYSLTRSMAVDRLESDKEMFIRERGFLRILRPLLWRRILNGNREYYQNVIDILKQRQFRLTSQEYCDKYTGEGDVIGSGMYGDVMFAKFLFDEAEEMCADYNKRANDYLDYLWQTNPNRRVAPPRHEQQDIDVLLKALQAHQSHLESVITKMRFRDLIGDFHGVFQDILYRIARGRRAAELELLSDRQRDVVRARTESSERKP